MARSIQVLLPLICLVLAEGRNVIFTKPKLPSPIDSYELENNQPVYKDVGSKLDRHSANRNLLFTKPKQPSPIDSYEFDNNQPLDEDLGSKLNRHSANRIVIFTKPKLPSPIDSYELENNQPLYKDVGSKLDRHSANRNLLFTKPKQPSPIDSYEVDNNQPLDENLGSKLNRYSTNRHLISTKPKLPSPIDSYEVNNNEPLDEDVGSNLDHDSWQHHVRRPKRQLDLPDGGNIVSYNGHRSFDPYNPFLHKDPYFEMRPFDMDNFDHMPGIDFSRPQFHNVFNVRPEGNYHAHKHKPSGEGNHPRDKPQQNHNINDVKHPDEKPKDIPPINDKPTEQHKDPKLGDTTNTDNITNNPEDLPPKTNAINKDDMPNEVGKKDDKQVGLDKKKDFLLVGSDNNGNNVYLLHENNPNMNGVASPNANQPGSNIVYVPYNPGQSTNQVYQVVTGQPTPIPTNQLTADKLNVNGYNNGAANNRQQTSSNQNPNYVLIYSNGQVLQIPGVVLNTAQNNVPVQNGNPGQGTQYIVANSIPNVQNNPSQSGNLPQGTQYILANTLPNNMPSVQNNVPLQNGNPQGTQYIIANALPNNMPSAQNPGTNVIYATLPNQGSNGQIYVQMPSCVHAVPNYVCGSSGAAQNPVQMGNNGGNIIPSNGSPSNVASYQPNQMMAAQAAVPNGASNGYAQPNMVPNQVQGPNVAVNIPSQGAVLNNPSAPFQPAVELPVNSAANGYNQPMSSNQGSNVPNTMNNQNVQSQPAASYPINGGSNLYNQPQGPNQGGQGTNPIVNIPSHDTVVNQPVIDGPEAEPANAVPKTDALTVDNNNLDALGAQPAIMISGFRETSSDKKDKKKDKKDKKDKSKKKDKKNKDADKSKEVTN